MQTSGFDQFGLWGAKPRFDRVIPVGQLYFPSPERYEAAFRAIFDRRYYTNQGPLTETFEEKLQNFLGVRNVVVVSNATIGLLMLPDAMGLSGKVILPAFTFVASAQSLSMAGIEPVFCDINRDTHQIDLKQIQSLIDEDVSAIMGINLWGGSCDPLQLSEIAKKNDVQLYFDSAQAFGCETGGEKIGGFGRAEVFSFHATKILSTTEGGCICTNDDELAERLRNIRSSYGTRRFVSVDKTSNGRMSEAQAAIGLMSLEDFSMNRNNNESLCRLYESGLSAVPGLRVIEPACVSRSNYQYLVCQVREEEFGLSRDLLVKLLRAENVAARRYFHPGLHRTIPYSQELPQYLDRLPITDQVCQSCLQLPVGQLVSKDTVELICDIVSRAHRAADSIRSHHEG